MESVKIKREFYTDQGNMEFTFEIKVGDSVGFKSDIEQYGRVAAIERNTGSFCGRSKYRFKVVNPNGFDGDYIGGDRVTWLYDEDIDDATIVEERLLDY